MDEKDNDIKQAIDDIFGDDVIEIESSNEVLTEENNDDLSATTLNIPIPTDVDIDVKIPEINDYTLDANNENDLDIKPVEESESNNNSFNKRILIYFIIGFVAGLILIYVIVNFVTGKEKVVSCAYSAEDKGYKITDEYQIKYKNDKILYVESEYNYTAKTDEYKPQIEYIKEEKLPVIINSNGMSGFTYVYETNENFFKVLGYLDFTLFDYEKINKINQKVNPISYFTINSKPSFKALKKSLEKDGYVCTISK